ncbi:hypothetical protein ACCUM_0311 [Candidatus Accumulibacter phosphatis]|uniref:Uncharacterized protein n=1 Tax=Candidatus Accumulibacter phosphatis TaxID=327160 RepID=A0A5S4F5B7_9PROT|nr:hypothetical protein ACCUM_0311 [Candidatus Accumulibacter phosphatis]
MPGIKKVGGGNCRHCAYSGWVSRVHARSAPASPASRQGLIGSCGNRDVGFATKSPSVLIRTIGEGTDRPGHRSSLPWQACQHRPARRADLARSG